MYELGKKDEIFGADKLVPLNISRKPTEYPALKEGEKVICGYDQGLGERLFVCDNLEDMQRLYAGYYSGGALSIQWYKGDDPGFIFVK